MSRRRSIPPREAEPDPRYRDKLIGKFVNSVMRKGKKSTAERVCYGAFEVIRERTNDDPLKVFRTAMENVKPVVEVKSRRVGGARIKCRSRFAPCAAWRWRFDGCANMPRPAPGKAWWKSSPLN